MKPLPKKIIILMAALLLGGGLIAGKFVLSRNGQARFVAVAVERGDIEQSVSASGTLNPVKLVNVGTQVSGVVQALHADFNDPVEKGQILLELDQSLLKTQLAASQANLTNAESLLKLNSANYRRISVLLERHYISRADLDKAWQEMESAKAQVKVAREQVERDRVNLRYTVIRSPVSGVVISRSVDIGQTVAASFQTPTLFTIAQDLKKMQIDTNLSEADVGGIREQMPVQFTVDAFPGKNFSGTVRQIRLNPTTVQNVVTYNVVIDVSNPDLLLLPGMTAFVTIIEAVHEGVLFVPNAALSFRPAIKKIAGQKQQKTSSEENNSFVFILKDDVPQRVTVKPGISNGKFTEIFEGELKENMSVITEEIITEKKSGNNRQQGSPGKIRL